MHMGGFPKLGVVTQGLGFRVSIIRIMVYWGSYWGPLVLGNYHIVTPVISVIKVFTKSS